MGGGGGGRWGGGGGGTLAPRLFVYSRSMAKMWFNASLDRSERHAALYCALGWLMAQVSTLSFPFLPLHSLTHTHHAPFLSFPFLPFPSLSFPFPLPFHFPFAFLSFPFFPLDMQALAPAHKEYAHEYGYKPLYPLFFLQQQAIPAKLKGKTLRHRISIYVEDGSIPR